MLAASGVLLFDREWVLPVLFGERLNFAILLSELTIRVQHLELFAFGGQIHCEIQKSVHADIFL